MGEGLCNQGGKFQSSILSGKTPGRVLSRGGFFQLLHRNSNNADMLLDSGLNLFNIMANLCSKLYCEVLLKSGNYIVYLLKWTSDLDFNKRGCVRQI